MSEPNETETDTDVEQEYQIGLGNMIINIFGVQTLIGLNRTLETFVPQAVGSKIITPCAL